MGYNNKMLSKELQRTINSVKTRKQNLRKIAKEKYWKIKISMILYKNNSESGWFNCTSLQLLQN